MDIKKALEILEIDLNTIKLTDITHEYIKRKYHRLALINHPDKNGNTEKFQQINEAYEFVSKELDMINGQDFNQCFAQGSAQDFNQCFAQGSADPTFVSSSTNNIENSRYIYYLSLFIESIIQGSYKELIRNVIKEIVTINKDISLERIFEELDNNKILEL